MITERYALVRFHHKISIETLFNGVLQAKPGTVIRLYEVNVNVEFPEDVDAVALESLLNDGHHMHIARLTRIDGRHFVVTFFRSGRADNDRWIPVIRILGIKIVR